MLPPTALAALLGQGRRFTSIDTAALATSNGLVLLRPLLPICGDGRAAPRRRRDRGHTRGASLRCRPMQCPACGSSATRTAWRDLTDRLFRTTAERFAVGACTACGSRFLDPTPPVERLAGYYPDGYWMGTADGGDDAASGQRLVERYRRFVLRDHVRFVGRVVRAQRARGVAVRVLDVGCGDGSFLQALGERDCVGMDLSLPALRAARARGVRGVRGTLADCPLRPGTFALVTAFHFVEHVCPPEPVLAAMRALLAPGGELVLQVPNARSWQAKLIGRRWHGYDVPRHLVDYSDRAFLGLLDRCGFDVLAVNHHCLRDNPTTAAISLVPGLFPPARIARGGAQSGLGALAADLTYLAVTLACTPLAVLESLCGRGASIMVHCRPR
jgi:SAM-dependent methyltransferase